MAAEVEASTQAAATAASESRLKEQERAAAAQAESDERHQKSRREMREVRPTTFCLGIAHGMSIARVWTWRCSK